LSCHRKDHCAGPPKARALDHGLCVKPSLIGTRLTEHDDVINPLLREAPRLGFALGPTPRSCIGPRIS